MHNEFGIPSNFILLTLLFFGLITSCSKNDGATPLVQNSPSLTDLTPIQTLIFTPTVRKTVAPSMTSTMVPTDVPTPSSTPEPTSTTTLIPPTLTPLVHPPLLVVSLNFIVNLDTRLFTLQPDGSGLTQIAAETHVETPVWSPDGRKIAFLSGASNNTRQLSILDYEDRKIQKFEYSGVYAFTWSPDSEKIAFVNGQEEPGNNFTKYNTYSIYIGSMSDLKVETLYHMPMGKNILKLYWSPQGDKILATFITNGLIFLRSFSTTSGEYDTLPTETPGITSVAWDPKGNQIAYAGLNVEKSIDKYSLWIISEDESSSVKIFEGQPSYDISWSPDGSKIAFSTDCCGNRSDIIILDVKKQDYYKIKTNDLFAYFPSWSPDGAFLTYLSQNGDVKNSGYDLNIYSLVTGQTMKLIKGNKVEAVMWRP